MHQKKVFIKLAVEKFLTYFLKIVKFSSQAEMSRKLNLIQGFIKLYEDYLGKTLKIKKKQRKFHGNGGLVHSCPSV